MIGESYQLFFLSTLGSAFYVLYFNSSFPCSSVPLFIYSLLILAFYTAAAVYVDIADQSFAFETDKTTAIGFG